MVKSRLKDLVKMIQIALGGTISELGMNHNCMYGGIDVEIIEERMLSNKGSNIDESGFLDKDLN